MPRKGMRSICFEPRTTSLLTIPRRSRAYPARLTNRPCFSESTKVQNLESATAMITKWDPDSSTFARVTSLFYEDKREAMEFLKCINDLQKGMHLLVSEDSASEKLIQAQNLMQIAMKRLQKEFYQILSINRAHLDPESVSTRSSRSARSSISDYEDDGSPEDDDVQVAGDFITEVEEVSSIAMADLKSIADCMISAGYAKECISIYKVIRKSIIDEGIYRLGVDRVSNSQINKMDWETLDFKISNWLDAVKIAMRTLFNGEKILCDHVFASSDHIKKSCFSDISKEGAMLLFRFPELVAKTKKSPPEKIFRLLGMYTVMAENWPEIESIFAHESISNVRLQALNSLVKLSDSVRAMISNFESSTQKESSKFQVAGGGVHPLTVQTMNYLSLLADYSNVLTDILADWPPPAKSSFPELYSDNPESTDGQVPAITLHVAWLILVLLCKLDTKAELYKDVSLSYLFLANNLQHVVSKVRTSNLQHLLGEEWTHRHEAKVRQFAANYERVAWDQVSKSLPDNPTAAITPDQAKDYLKNFQSSFEQAHKQQSSFIVADPKLRDEIKVSIGRKLVAKYREFYDKHMLIVREERNGGMVVRFCPEDVGNYLSDLFFGTTYASGSSGSSSTSSSHHRRHSLLKA
ncbi:exocyst complex component EXO70H1-like [Mangifera indica]|uniref:exocyst complex component EXO70H1-like n=1 Tax=Mangifera indica TaxID=29780 RepID=UPI001CF96B63|nr:exocyst complex component EXO70H1-like [Mangifera indica]